LKIPKTNRICSKLNMFPSNPRFVLALLAVCSYGNFLVSVDGKKCKIKPVDGHVDWPSKKKNIGKNAFKNCKELVTISIPPTVKSIDNTAFVKSGLDLTDLTKSDVDSPSLFSLKGPLQIERSEEGEPKAVLAVTPSDYTLKFTIELKSINDDWTSIIHLTNGGWAPPDFPYGTRVPGVFVYPGTTKIVAFVQYDDDLTLVQTAIHSQPLEFNKKYTVIIKVDNATAGISINGRTENTATIGPRTPPNNVDVYIGSPWWAPADAIVSDIFFG